MVGGGLGGQTLALCQSRDLDRRQMAHVEAVCDAPLHVRIVVVMQLDDSGASVAFPLLADVAGKSTIQCVRQAGRVDPPMPELCDVPVR